MYGKMHTPDSVSNGSYGFLLCLISYLAMGLGNILLTMDINSIMQMIVWLFSIAVSTMGIRHFYILDRKRKDEKDKSPE